MESSFFPDTDRLQMESLGIDESKIQEQLERFRKCEAFIHLERPCTPGDGVHRIPERRLQKYLRSHQKAAGKGRYLKFVPASGAATRMFQSLLYIYHAPHFLEYDELRKRAGQGVSIANDFMLFLENIARFPFCDDLMDALARKGLDLDLLIREHRYLPVLECLLTENGLKQACLPKALLKFHLYPHGSRTAFEEHLVEAVDYVRDAKRLCHLHFTVAPEHEAAFMRVFNKSRKCYENRLNVLYEVGFSFQKPSTSTVAVDLDNELFRDRHGRIVFRPGGHGALLENLDDLQGDLVYVRNIDNIAPHRLQKEVVHWKKVLGGMLVEVQEKIHHFLRALHCDPASATIHETATFAQEQLSMQLPQGFEAWEESRKAHYLFQRLNRPIRVCGVVKNVGEPGGAPFWVRDKAGTLSLQIVEKAQVNMDNDGQRSVWESSTHFNPVDIVCAVRDFRGVPFSLQEYVDPEAVFITRKSKEGKELKALELPGLWNGSMSDWITIAVEVPRNTFNPVKTVFDLLRPEHQSEDF